MSDVPVRRGRRVQTAVTGVSRVKQSFKGDSDVNSIMRKYLNTGMLAYQNRSEPRYGDFSSGDDYFAAALKVQHAQELFMQLPANIRQHFKNDPGLLIAAAFDPDRRKEFETLGLVSEAVKPPDLVTPTE